MAQSSTIDAYLADLGVKPDADIAKLAGVSVSAVYQFRRARGIGVVTRSKTKGTPTKAKAAVQSTPKPKPTDTTRKGRRGPASKLDARLDIVGVLADADVAKRVGITRAAVAKYRTRHGIAPGSASTAKTAAKTKRLVAQQKKTPPKGPAAPRASKLDGFAHQIGVVPDAEIARRAGVSRERVRQVRLQLGGSGAKSGEKVAVTAPARQTAAPIPGSKSRPAGPAGGTAPTPVPTLGTSCWRVSLRDGSATHLAAGSAEEAARRAHAALGDTAVGVVWLGSLIA